MRAPVLLALLASSTLQAQGPTPQAAGPQSTPQIAVGTEVQVSKAFPNLAHYENLAAGDESHVGRLIACSTVTHQDLAAQGEHCYTSFDNGETWSTVLELDKGPRNSDPATTYGRGDTVFVVNEYTPFPGQGKQNDQNRMEVYRSVDGGKQWTRSATFEWIDRQAVVVDKTGGRYAGRVYISGVSKGYYFAGGPASVVLYRSTDGGVSFTGPVERQTVEGGGLLGASNSVVLSDGTVAFATFHIKTGRALNAFDEDGGYRSGNAEFQLLTSGDGGESLDPWVTISDASLGPAGAQISELAVDPGSPFFKDRLYAVWADAGSGRVDIRLAFSTDKGKTWSRSIIVNDDRPPADPSQGPDHLLPAVGVNKDGAVLVTWYDRRESRNNTGWTPRAAASLDGGVTFTPSVALSDMANVYTDATKWVLGAPSISGGGVQRAGGVTGRSLEVGLAIDPFFLSGGDTDGIAVGADGTFHAVWVDNRTGISQLWTAPVVIRGSVEKYGASELRELDDVTDHVALEALSTNFDRASGTLTFTVRMRNTSTEAIRAPLKARVVRLASQLGVATIVGADNGMPTTGAIWDFTMADRGLPPDSATAPRTLTFHLSDLRAIRPETQSRAFVSGLARFDVRVYGKIGGGKARS